MAKNGRLIAASSSWISVAGGKQVCLAAMSAAIVYVAYLPHDSVEVQQGAARFLVAGLMGAWAVSIASYPLGCRRDLIVDALSMSLAAWMTLSLVVNAADANLRSGINELGWWLATAAVIGISRRVATNALAARSLMRLLIAVTVAMAIYGWHQKLIGFPEMIAEFERDPADMLAQAGIDDGVNSPMRVMFENRLRDGGPTGTFALANSLAAMLLGGWIVMIGILASSWAKLDRARRTLFVAAIVMVGGIILASRSRTAVVAILGIGGWFLASTMIRRPSIIAIIRLHPRTIIAAIAVAVIAMLASVQWLRQSEWISQAPLSVSIRLSYWTSCLEMLSRSPIFGIGPGQFKAVYECFRAPTSLEQIADPHQFLLQTATAGGWPAMVILLAIMVAMVWLSRRALVSRFGDLHDRSRDDESRQLGSDVSIPRVMKWSAGIAAFCVWAIGGVVGQLPTLEPAFLGTLAAILFAAYVWPRGDESASDHDGATYRSVAGYAVVAIAIDLLASGGITVPGISVVGWMLAGIASPVAEARAHSAWGDVAWPMLKGRVMATMSIVGFTITWYFPGIAPVNRTQNALAEFEDQWSRGQYYVAIDSVEQAVMADPWDPSTAAQAATAAHAVAMNDAAMRSRWIERWHQAETRAAARSPLDPVIANQLGDLRLTFFQRFGDPGDLAKAESWYALAVERSPSHETYAAQWAAVLAAIGDRRAPEVARRAQALSVAGGYYERSLDFVQILTPSHAASGVDMAVDLRPASDVLKALIGTPNVGDRTEPVVAPY